MKVLMPILKQLQTVSGGPILQYTEWVLIHINITPFLYSLFATLWLQQKKLFKKTFFSINDQKIQLNLVDKYLSFLLFILL